jgi:hypothetical protein
MKNLFTLMLALALMGSMANGQQRTFFKSQKTDRDKAKVAKPITSDRTITPKTTNLTLKSALLADELTGVMNYNWDGEAWVFSSSSAYDTQGRLSEMTYSNNSRSIIEYVGTTTTNTTFQTRANSLSPWENVSRMVAVDEEFFQLNEQWVYSSEDGWLMISGSKYEESIETVGLVTTEISANYQFDLMGGGYVQNGGYKLILELNAAGNYLREDEYNWDSSTMTWVKTWEQWFEYDMDGTLLFMHSIYDDIEENIEMVYGPNEADGPVMGYIYRSEGGSPLALEGRYIDIVWGAEWSALLQGNDLEPASGTIQKVIDPDGDKMDDNNYVNSEKFASSEDLYEWYVWVDDAWMLIENYKIELDGLGVETTTDMMLEFDKDLNMVIYGYQEIDVVDGDNYTFTEYEFDIDLQVLVPSTKESYVVLDALGSYEMTNSIWADFNEDEVFEWETEDYTKVMYNTGSVASSINQQFEMGEMIGSENYEYNYDPSGMMTYLHRFGLTYGTLVPFDEEYTYEVEYDGTKILSVIAKHRTGGEPNVYENVSKTVNIYGTGTGLEELQLATKVYPTVFNEAVTVVVSDPSVVEILNVNGQLVLRVGKVAGESSIQTSELLPGVYFIRIESDGKTAEVIKVIKK